MTVNAGGGDDTINVGSPAPGTVDGIKRQPQSQRRRRHRHPQHRRYRRHEPQHRHADADDRSPAWTWPVTITYDSFATLNVGLGTAGDTFTINGTHAGTTNVNGNNGDDVFNIEAISGPTTVERRQRLRHVQRRQQCGGHRRHGRQRSGIGDDIGDVLTINGNAPTSGSDCCT